jgi:hypothetical protein
MKSFIAGALTIVALGVIGFYTFKATTSFMSRLNSSPSPTPSMTATPSPTPSATAKPSTTPSPSYAPTTKKGTVKGAQTTKTTTTTSHLLLTLVKSSTCPISYMTEVKDIQGPLTLKYSLKDGYSFGITIWRADGNELLTNTTYSGNSGTIKTISGVDYMKVRVESKSCSPTSDNWLTLTAER